MSKILSKIFPIFDHLYIYQILEYKSLDFIKWFFKNPFKRNLQKKHNLEWTKKARLLALVSIALWLLDALITSFVVFGSYWWTLMLAPVKALYFPLFLIVAQLILLPFENYQKEKIITAAKEKLRKLKNLKIVAITGSFGKTSAKDILFTLLWKKYYAVKTQRSFNTPLSIARTVLEDLKNNTDIFIAEAGAYKKGEIETIARLLNPDIGIITAVAPQHLERFGSIENIAKAKFELAENLKPGGTILLNNESRWLQELAANLKNVKVKFYGGDSSKTLAQIPISLTGENHVKNFVAAATAALELGLTLSEIKDRAKLLLPTPHRLEIRKQGSMTIIDNTYNTNPDSSKTSLRLLKELKGSQKILITPGLIELGKESSRENREFAKEAGKIADLIIIVGEYAKKDLLAGISDKEKVVTVSSTADAIKLLPNLAKPDAVVLLENDLPDQYS